MTACSEDRTAAVAAPSIPALPAGEILPLNDDEHASWRTLGEWRTPLCPLGGHRKRAYLLRAEHGGRPCIEWIRGPETDQAFVAGEPSWRDYSLNLHGAAVAGGGWGH